MKQRLNQLIADETGQPLEKVAEDTDRDYWMTVEEAIDYGIVTKVVNSITEI
jgi:ATP-dependent Clp protease protease subunit